MSTPSSILFPALGLGEGSGLAVRESLRPIENGQRRRTINGRLRHTGRPEFNLYELEISSDDVQPPALSRLWAGTIVTIVPVSELGDYVGNGGTTVTLVRDPHPGSVRTRDSQGLPVPLSVVGRVVTLAKPADGLVRLHYRPVLTLMVTEAWTQDEAETGGAASTSWSISLAEVGG
ncbi:hypothetical protein [Aureimonas sp. SK2]|uniref:hypothetical protein n=1 Tax=Aureimonas sp. SK2 TaxID=3015992 RepID=UPI002443A967|nr:hypothetical protein [Aureimonas sp. SK2]